MAAVRNGFEAGKIHYEWHWKGWALEIQTFLGPEMATSEAGAIWALRYIKSEPYQSTVSLRPPGLGHPPTLLYSPTRTCWGLSAVASSSQPLPSSCQIYKLIFPYWILIKLEP
jgi:hypothetical protein